MKTSYQSFILRLWREAEVEFAPWRIVLVNPQTNERQAFTEVKQLTTFLNDQIYTFESQKKEVLRDHGGKNDTDQRK